MNVTNALLYARTIPTLRPVQVFGRLWRRVRRPRPDLSPPPPARGSRGWVRGAEPAPSLLGPERFRLLNQEGEVRGAADWNAPDRPKLWLYNLHYFDDLNAKGAGDRDAWHRRLVERWIEENPPGEGNGWEPYPLSLRLVNWMVWALRGNPLSPDALHALAVQARYLRADLEHHILGNHLLENAKALVFAGCFFQGPEADGWRRKGLALLDRELREQVLDDGGHFERSPMYHARVLQNVLDLVNLARAVPDLLAPRAAGWRRLARPMREWLADLTHPDGGIAFFNDAALEIAPTCAELEAYAQRLGMSPLASRGDGLTHHAATGYARLQRGPAVALVDVGEIGPSYLPGHAHADSLGFELSLFDARWIVHSGTSLYEAGPERARQRSTAAHNTIVVDGADSSEVWSAFRVARRARPRDLELEERGGELQVRCAHDGYRRLPGRVLHRREWTLSERGLRVRDRLEGRWDHATSLLHLHPDIRVEGEGSRLSDPRGLAAAFAATGGVCEVESSTWHPEFGSSLPSRRIAVELRAPESDLFLRW